MFAYARHVGHNTLLKRIASVECLGGTHASDTNKTSTELIRGSQDIGAYIVNLKSRMSCRSAGLVSGLCLIVSVRTRTIRDHSRVA